MFEQHQQADVASSGSVVAPSFEWWIRNTGDARVRTADAIEDLFASACKFDVNTSVPLSRSLQVTLSALHSQLHGGTAAIPKDSFYRISETLRDAIREILANPEQRLRREHRVLPLNKIREQDVRCLRWAAKLPGRNSREKFGSTSKSLGVVRQLTSDTTENRLVKRVAEEFRELLSQRLPRFASDKGHQCNRERRRMFEDLFRLCSSGLSDSSVGSVASMRRLQLNNTLLRDRRYRRVLSAWRWLAHKNELVASTWSAAPAAWSSALRWLLVAELAASKGASIAECICTPRLPSTGREVNYNFDVVGIRKSVVLQSAGSARLVCVEQDGEHTSIIIFRLTGATVLSPEMTDLVQFRSSISTVEPYPTARGTGLAVQISSISSQTKVVNTYADLSGFREIVSEIKELIAPGFIQCTPDQVERDQWATLDLALPLLRTFNGKTCMRSTPLIAACTLAEDRHWIVGEAARSIDPSDVEAGVFEQYSISQLWAKLGTGIDSQERAALSHIFALACKCVSMTATVIVPIPDDIEEYALQEVRSALPRSLDCWTPWRSVLTAMEWRRVTNATLTEGECVVVLDFDALLLCPAMLIYRIEECEGSFDDKSGWDGGCWEHPAVLRTVLTGPSTVSFDRIVAARQISDSLPREADPVYTILTRQLVEFGLLDSESLVPIGNGPAETRRWFRPSIDEECRAACCDEYIREFESWLREWAVSAMPILNAHAQSAPLRLLLTGRLLEDSDLGGRVSSVVKSVLGFPSEISPTPGTCVARGGNVFLTRLKLGLPSYRDVAPTLDLEVEGADGRKELLRIFPLGSANRTVRPGDVVEGKVCVATTGLPKKIVIPANVPFVSFPLRRDGESRPGFVARVLSPSFPLQTAEVATLNVRFRYAKDAFQIRVEPVDSVGFVAGEVLWSRLSTTDRQLDNTPPEFPASIGWQDSIHVSEFKLVAERLVDCSDALFDKNRYAQLRTKQYGPHVISIREGIDDLSSCCRDLGQLASSVFLPLRSAEDVPHEVSLALGSVLPVLSELASLPVSPRRYSRQLGRVDFHPVAFRGAIQKLFGLSRDVLARFRCWAPESLLPTLIAENLSSKLEVQLARFHMIGRASASRPDLAESVLGSLLPELNEALESADAKRALGPIWALNTAAWTSRDFILSLDSTTSESLAITCSRYLQFLSLEENTGVARELASEIGMTLLTLLRLRGTASGQVLAAGLPLSETLADAVEGAAISLAARGGMRSPRLRLGGCASEQFAVQLCAALRGERRIYVVALEDTNE